MDETAREVCGSIRVGGRTQSVCGGMMRSKLQLGERRLVGKRFWQLAMKRKKKNV